MRILGSNTNLAKRANGKRHANLPAKLCLAREAIICGQVDQADLPGVEGDFGVLNGSRTGRRAAAAGDCDGDTEGVRDRFVVLGGLAEFSDEELTILADTATSVDDFDLAGFKATIEEMQEGLTKKSADELDRAIARLDHYKSIHTSLATTTAF